MGDERHAAARRIPVPYTLAVFLLLAGCGGAVQTFYADPGLIDVNYATFEYPFTQAGEADAKRRADSQCGEKKRVAVMTRRACSLNRCTTSFQCMSPDEAAGYAQGTPKKP